MSVVRIPRIVNRSPVAFDFENLEFPFEKGRIAPRSEKVLTTEAARIPHGVIHNCMRLRAADGSVRYAIWQATCKGTPQIRISTDGIAEQCTGKPITGDSVATSNFVATLIIEPDCSIRLDRQYSQTRLTAWAVPVPDTPPDVADHTWLVGEDRFVESCTFGVEPAANALTYNGPNRWQGGVYTPPVDEGWRRLGSTAGLSDWGRAIAGAPYTEFLLIPSQGGIAYGINGVCHHLVNRMVFDSPLTVSGASGYWFSEAVFGRFGTNVPLMLLSAVFGWSSAFVLAFAYQVKVIADWQRMVAMFGPLGVRRSDSESELAQRIAELYDDDSAPDADAELTAEDLVELRRGVNRRHRQELELTHEARQYRVDAGVLEAHLAFWDEVDQPTDEQIEALAAELPTVRLSELPPLEAPGDPAELAELYNRSATELRDRLVAAIGEDGYRAIYRAEPDAPIAIVEPDIFAGYGRVGDQPTV